MGQGAEGRAAGEGDAAGDAVQAMIGLFVGYF